MRYANAAPALEISGAVLTPDDVQNIWLRRPKPVSIPARDDAAEHAHVVNEWGEALEGFLAHVPRAKWMNHPVNNVAASHKLEQLTRAEAYGLAAPRTLVTQSNAELRGFWSEMNGRVIVKPLASGFLEREDGAHTSIYTNRVEADQLESPVLSTCPTLFQEEIEKVYDVRLTAVDDVLTAVALRRDDVDDPDVRRDNMRHVHYEVVQIPLATAAAVRALLHSYDLRFAAVDFGVTERGEWVFFEINPNGQWAWLDLVGVTHLWQNFDDAFHA
ncbi:MAG TPA: ATP-grasp ribosomal peptide maturase [Thermoanaerobaculia bacterium]|nr:ATP-grasp ribosomal peptide maturase [Thermoanaerobaculia bacterium]